MQVRKKLNSQPRLFAFVVVVALSLAVATAQDLQDPFGNDLTKNTCYSTTDQFKSSNLLMRAIPDRKVPLYTFEGLAPRIEIQCMNLIEVGRDGGAARCSSSSLIWLCKAMPETTEWECEALPNYIGDPKTYVIRGDAYGQHYQWRLEWDAVNKASFCYPRDVFFTMIGTTTFPNSGTVGAVVVFTVIAVLVLGLVVVFGGHTLKRQLARKFGSDDAPQMAPDAPPAIPLSEAMRDLEEVEAQRRGLDPTVSPLHSHSPNRALDQSGRGVDLDATMATTEGEIFGGRDTFTPSGRVKIPTHPSLYQKSLEFEPIPGDRPRTNISPPRRQQFNGSGLSPLQQFSNSGNGGDSYYGGSPRGAPANDYSPARGAFSPSSIARSMNTSSMMEERVLQPPLPIADDVRVVPTAVHDILVGHNNSSSLAAVSSPRRRSMPPEVLVCADCMLRIQEKSTPKYCTVTGKRHY